MSVMILVLEPWSHEPWGELPYVALEGLFLFPLLFPSLPLLSLPPFRRIKTTRPALFSSFPAL